MTAETKEAYYRNARMVEGLARRYYRMFGSVRRILDVGCGTGEFGAHRPSSDIEIHGVDADRGAVERAARFEAAVCVDLERERLPYEDASFDGVLAKDVLEHLCDPGRVVGEIRRVLRPGGLVIASVVMAKPSAVWADYTHVRGFTKRSAALLFEDHGFQVERVWRMGGVPLSSRLGFIDAVPTLLAIPPFGRLWASSWELAASP